MKPKIWKQGSKWLCSYYHHTLPDEASWGFTPYLAWYMWKYRIIYVS